MKKLILTFAILFSLLKFSTGQEIPQYIGSPNSAIHIEGRLYIDSLFVLPFNDTASINSPIIEGALIYEKTDQSLYFFNGSFWEKIPTKNIVNSAFLKKSDSTVKYVTPTQVSDSLSNYQDFDSLYLAGKWIKEFSDDTTLGTGSDEIIPTQGAVKGAIKGNTYFTNISQNNIFRYGKSAYDFQQGILVKTNITSSSPTMYLFKIYGNSYNTTTPISFSIQGHTAFAADTSNNLSFVSNGIIEEANLFEINDTLYLFFTQKNRFQTFYFSLYTAQAMGRFKILSVKNSTIPINAEHVQTIKATKNILEKDGNMLLTNNAKYIKADSLNKYIQINNSNLPYSNGYFSIFDTSFYNKGNIDGQHNWTGFTSSNFYHTEWKRSSNAIISDTALNVIRSGNTGAILNRNFSTGIISLGMGDSSNFLIGLNWIDRNKSRYAIWTNGDSTLVFGEVIDNQYGFLDTTALKRVSTPVLKGLRNYILRIKKESVGSNGSGISVGFKADNIDSSWHNFDFNVHLDSLFDEGFITLSTLSDTSTFFWIKVKDYKNENNYLTSKANFIGNWFNNYANDTFNLATITSGSGIRFSVIGTENVSLKFSIASPVSTYPPILDISYRNVSRNGDWSDFKRDTIYPTGSVANGFNILNVLSGLSADSVYQVKLSFDITPFDSLWHYGNSVLVNNILVDKGGKVWPNDISEKPVIMGIGNSITAGVLQKRNPESWPVSTSNNLISSNNFLHILCDSLDAIPFNQGYGASGIFKDGSGGLPPTLESLKYFKRGIKRKTKVQPSLILINIGTNDVVSNSKFEDGYKQLLGYLQSEYPNSQIAPMIPFNQDYAEQIRSAAGFFNLPVIETSDWNITYTVNQTLHPDTTGQKTAGDSLFHWIKRNIVLTKPEKNKITTFPENPIKNTFLDSILMPISSIDLDTIRRSGLFSIPLKGSIHIPVKSAGGFLINFNRIDKYTKKRYRGQVFIVPTGTVIKDSIGIYYRVYSDFTNGFSSWQRLADSTTLSNGGYLNKNNVKFNSSYFSGDGTTTSFTMPISVGFTPSKIMITPTSPDAAKALFFVSAITSTSFTITAAGVIPPSGTNNITFDYMLIE